MDVMFVDELLLQDHLNRNDDLSHDDEKVSCRKERTSATWVRCGSTGQHRAREQTCDDVADFVRVIVPAEEVGEPHDHQPQDGDEDADPLTGRQASAQEGHREQAGEDDDSPAQHLETGGAGHVESYNRRQKDNNMSKTTKAVNSPGPIASTFLPEVLTHIHDGGGRHVTHGRREKEERIEALARVHLGFWASSVTTN